MIPEPVLHAYTKERDTCEDSTFRDPSSTLAQGSVMITNIYDLATSAPAIGTGKLVSEKSHKEQVGSSLVAGVDPPRSAPRTSVLGKRQASTTASVHIYRRGVDRQPPSFYGWGALRAYLLEKDQAIAAAATLDKEAEVGLSAGQMVFNEIAAVFAPDHSARPPHERRPLTLELPRRRPRVKNAEILARERGYRYRAACPGPSLSPCSPK